MNLRNTIHSLLRAVPLRSSIAPDEQVVFFPTAADLHHTFPDVPHWHIPIHGKVYKPTEFSRLRRAGLWLAQRCLSRKARHDPKEFASVPEMAALYRRWAHAGAAFHYISASPWHLYPFLAEFLQAHKFPPGTFHLRDLRLMPADLHRSLRSGRSVKLRHARALL